MISVQYPSFSGHPFGLMAESALHSALPTLSKAASAQPPFGLAADSKAKQTTTNTTTKKRPSRAGTRSVTTLTAAQLERKRANDREAQRAIRQRTKDHIDNLERQIRELTASSDTNAKLMQTIQRNQELEQENALLRSRLNHAVTTMSEHGLNSDHIMLTGSPNSPTRRIKLATQLRNSATPVPRSIPTPSVPSVGPQEQWGATYSPATSSIDRSPSIADVSPVAGTMRWGQNSPQVSAPIHEPERPMHPVDPTIQQSMNYNYAIDSSGRPVQPVQPVAYHSEAPMMPAYTQPASPADYHGRHPGQQIPAAQTPAYAQYPAAQGFIPHSPHESDPHLQMMHRQSLDSQQQIMYSMPPNMKAEQ
ncbi:uncharacterized protein PV09_06423 [Verruconis gallopava]|uniref:BZIP domain-containing protein n=1 Tax=Verruconis gallopava TaxID=253628 RepID=A0A0D2A698_9PEZI|nr:uncharacterized protein PV09_06423 [Verruconis gallopava]KIW02273.1 hypothetical protein PV09_06423 [Verruconis gallopava]